MIFIYDKKKNKIKLKYFSFNIFYIKIFYNKINN